MGEVVRKHALDEKVAELLGVKTSKVSAITAAFLGEARRALAEEGAVRLDGLGTLHVTCRRGKRAEHTRLTSKHGTSIVVDVLAKYYVSFKKARQLTLAMAATREPAARNKRKEKVMEKFGVDESADENLEKQAAEGCPECGKKPELHGKVLMCPVHGSEPFEKKSK